MLKIELTKKQKQQLEPYFQAVRTANEKYHPDIAIAAQVFEDGMVVRLMQGDKGKALAKALGGEWSKVHYSAEERLSS